MLESITIVQSCHDIKFQSHKELNTNIEAPIKITRPIHKKILNMVIV